MRRRSAAALFSCAAALATAACLRGQYKKAPRVAVVDGDPIVQMKAPGKLPDLVNPRSVPYREHTDPPFRNEKVVGVTLEEPARMYPIGLLDTYEVVNDEAGGVPFVVARCALTDLSAVYDRRAAGRALTFENSGAIWRDMLVLRDEETGTLWSPATGRALFGPLAGERLSPIPAPVTTAEAWEELYPATVCLETGDLTAVPLTLRLYASSPWEGISGRRAKDARYPPKERVFFVAEGGHALAFTAAELREKRSLAASLGESPVTLEWDTGLRAPRAFRQAAAGSREELPVLPIYWFALLEQFPGAATPALR